MQHRFSVCEAQTLLSITREDGAGALLNIHVVRGVRGYVAVIVQSHEDESLDLFTIWELNLLKSLVDTQAEALLRSRVNQPVHVWFRRELTYLTVSFRQDIQKVGAAFCLMANRFNRRFGAATTRGRPFGHRRVQTAS